MNLYVCISKKNNDVKYFLSENINNINKVININNYTTTKAPKVITLTLSKEQLITC